MTRCPLCGKKPMMANKRKLLRGHYNVVNRYKKYPNLQWAFITAENFPKNLRRRPLLGGKRLKICTSCIKKLNKA